jgi:hypothetical protein
VVYAVVGILAFQFATGSGGKTTGTAGAIHTIGSQPFGTILLTICAVGMAAYALWRLIQAFYDPEHSSDDPTSIPVRIGIAISGISYALLAVWAVQLALFRGGGSGGEGTAEGWTAGLLQLPFGRAALAAIGLLLIGVGVYQAYRAVTASFMESYETSRMSQAERTWARRFGRFGLSARAVSFVIIGISVVVAAVRVNPDEVMGLGESLAAVASHTHGQIMLSVVAAGFIAYGLYCFSRAWYRRIAS